MARLANPPTESGTIFIDDPTSKNSLGSRQIEVRCVYLEDLLGKTLWYCVCPNSFSIKIFRHKYKICKWNLVLEIYEKIIKIRSCFHV